MPGLSRWMYWACQVHACVGIGDPDDEELCLLDKPGKCRGLEAENWGKWKKQMLAGIDASNAV